MAIGRAFTSKRARADHGPSAPQRSASARTQQVKPLLRSQISAPVQLLSTTNMLSFNAPDIHDASPSSVGSTDDSDGFNALPHSPATSVEPSPVDSRPTSPDSKHLSTHFQLGPLRSVNESSRHDSASLSEGPAIPQRAPSHTKATHSALARKRSQRRVSPPNIMPTSRDVIDSVAPAHPFGKELQQVNEVAEEYGVRRSLLEEEEERLLREQGLSKFGAHDYISEIESLLGGVFEDRLLPMGSAWI
ncbi:MAG: hypothetical protein M1815_002155 [Lichina confinis]|nr:MAG: hypothetical protein M1815_002155 [Lichina confinis]